MRRLVVVILALIGGSALLATGSVPCGAVPLQPRCSVALHPGPVEDTLRIVEIADERTYASTGQLLLTTVSVDSDLRARDLLTILLSREIDRVPREALFPSGTGVEEVRRANRVAMDESQVIAAVAALRYLGHEVDLEPVGAEIVGTLEGSPAEEVLEAGDVVVAVDDEEVSSAEEAVDAIRGLPAGRSLHLSVQRRGSSEVEEVRINLEEDPDDVERGRIGALLGDKIALPVDVAIDAGPIGGPSAGLMFALAVVDLLTAEDLTTGTVIAGTGSVDAHGEVRAMGGVRQKLVASTDRPERPATVFLVPAANAGDARRAPIDRRVLVVPVHDLAQAVDALRSVARGDRPPGSFTAGPG